VPLWNTREPQIAAAEASVAKSRIQQEVVRRRIAQEILAACTAVNSTGRRIEAIAQDRLRHTGTLAPDALFLYDAGELSLVELLDAVSAALEARMLKIDLLHRYAVSWCELDRAIGALPPDLEDLHTNDDPRQRTVHP
jgi:cobalt-zinc-cadmium efflux system outer membrane protein